MKKINTKIRLLFHVSILMLVINHPGWGNDTLSVEFYDNTFLIHYDKSILVKHYAAPSDVWVEKYLAKMEKTNYQPLVDSLLALKASMKLEDWLYDKLLVEVTAKLFPQERKDYRALFRWFMLTKSGYDTRLGYHNQIEVYVYSSNSVRDVPRFEEGRTFVCLNCEKIASTILLSGIHKNPTGKIFSFTMNELPILPTQKIITKVLHFNHQHKYYHLDIELNETRIKVLNTRPEVSLSEYFKTFFLSPAAYQSLIPQLRKLVAGKTESETVSFLLSFVAIAFEYKRDDRAYGKEKWMTLEEALYYPYLDCEDKSLLFYYLVKELVDLPMIILFYPTHEDINEHVNVGVAIKGIIQAPIVYKGRSYVVCEPTGPTKEGNIDDGDYFKSWPYEVIGEYNPPNSIKKLGKK